MSPSPPTTPHDQLDDRDRRAGGLEQNGHPNSVYRSRPVRGPGGAFHCTWSSITTLTADRAAAIRIIPDNRSDFIVSDAGQSWFVGPATVVDLTGQPPGTVISGLRLQPYAPRMVTGVTGLELTDRRVAFGDLLSSRRARLLAEALWEERVDERLLRDLWPDLRSVPPLRTGIRALEEAPQLPIGAIADGAGLSPRHFRRLVQQETGLTPKTVQRVGRLHRFLKRAETASGAPLATLAFASGFADQAHLTREVTALTGLPPLQLLRERAAD